MNHPAYLFIVGAPKCGTSSLAAWLDGQEGVALSRPKEPCYFTDFAEHEWTGCGTHHFNAPWTKYWSAYEKLFPIKGRTLWRVDASTDYLWNEPASDRIAFFSRSHHVKIVIVLRDPVERAISEHQHLLRDGYTEESLIDALSAEEERKARRMHPLFYHVTRSLYNDAVNRYVERFGNNVLILDYHEMKKDQGAVLGQLSNFLGISDSSRVPLKKINTGVVYKSPMLRRLINNSKSAKLAKMLVPKHFRAPIRSSIQKVVADRYYPKPTEIDAVRTHLKQEILACESNPLIPTKNWSLSKPET